MKYFEKIFEETLKDSRKVYSTNLNKSLKFSTLKKKFEDEIESVKNKFIIIKRKDKHEKNKFYTELFCKLKPKDEFTEVSLKNFLEFKKFFQGFENVNILARNGWLPQTTFNNYFLNSLKKEHYLRLQEVDNKNIIIIFSDLFREEN